ncbi:protein interacting with Ttk69 and Sin3A isoform X4 [Choristoneura fumiferana]|uniref:protein interacting with Ttk69 and Sin3A isoform X4 n=1 Tax=Choristoneura fumiferana TaxID=7141 RepID=UPI003D1552F1
MAMGTTGPRRYCSVFGCLNNSANPDLSFFGIPTQGERRLQWLNLIGRGDLISRDTRNVVCQIHFKDEDINKNNSFRKSLQKNALPCFHLPSLLNEDKLTQTDIATFNSSSQTDMSNVLNIVPEIVLKKESTTTATQTEISVKSANETQTPISLSADTPRKRKLKSELKECKKRLKVLNAGQTTVATSSQKNTFEKLCNRFLSKNLTELVKAQMRLKSSRKGNRYTLAYKMFCLNLYYASPQAYHLLAKSICLPSRPTLNRMYIPISTEVNDDLMAALKLRVNNMSEKEKQCTLVADAMSLKTNLFYDIKHDKIIGFDEVDGVQSPSPAKHALVILVQGIYEKWSQPIGFALLSECKSDNNISKWVDKIIDKLFEIGLKIRAFVSDLGSDLLNAAHKRGISIDKTHFTVNDHKIYYIFDAPHLIKLIRNNLMSYDFHFHNGAVAKFEHIAKFYEFDQKKTFKQAYKLTNSHINPNGCEKMKVRYATQLLSRSVASGLSTCIDFEVIDESARHTVEFVIMMNDLFDALNSSTMSHCYSHKNAFCGYDQQIDFFNKMLTFFQELKIMNSKKASDVTKTAKFIQGFQITIKSILHLYEDLNQEGYRYLMTRRLNKDVIDFFFGKIRSRSGMATEPTSRQFISAFRKLYFANMMQAPKEGNCTVDLTKYFVSLREFESIYNNGREIGNQPATVNDDAENNLQQITRSDYIEFDIPEKNAFLYICGALLRKCVDYHKDCDVLKSYVDRGTCNLGDEYRYIFNRNYSTERTLLVMPSNEFVSNIEKMEQVFRKAFDKDHINCKIGSSIFNQMKETEFVLPCPCFPKIYLQKLFIRMRIYFALMMNNKAFRTSRNRRKYFSVSNL